jgi:predicted metal-binding membrane protein
MLVLFVGGVMNLPLVALLSIVVAVEKLAPRGGLISRVIGLALMAGGVWKLGLA